MSPAEARPLVDPDALAPPAGPGRAGCCAATPDRLATTNTPTAALKTRCIILLYSYRPECLATVGQLIYKTIYDNIVLYSRSAQCTTSRLLSTSRLATEPNRRCRPSSRCHAK